MSRFTEDELLAAFAEHQRKVREITASGEWERFADLFTEDVDYIEHAYGRMRGRAEVAAWSAKTMGSFPGNHMTDFPANWVIADAGLGRIVCEVDNPFRDPGDGTHITAANITILDYAGDGLWSRAEDVYNPMHFGKAAMDWCAKAAELGTITEEARAWQEKMAKHLPR